jgi:hypothetical protein
VIDGVEVDDAEVVPGGGGAGADGLAQPLITMVAAASAMIMARACTAAA